MYRRQVLKSVGTLAAAVAFRATATHAPTTPASAAESVPMRHIVTADGTRLFHKDWGAGRPVVFVSSWSLDADMWADQMVALSGPEVRCIAFDRRGHGRSDDPGRGYDYDTLADDLAAVLAALDRTGVTLVAHSLGGGEAVRYLTRHGTRRVKRLLLLAPAGLPCRRQLDGNEG